MSKSKGLYRRVGDTVWVHHLGRTFTVPLKEESSGERRKRDEAAHSGELHSPMPGKILKMNVKIGDTVTKGQAVCVIEAMKMEYALKSPFDGKILTISKQAGDGVAHDEKVVVIEKAKA